MSLPEIIGGKYRPRSVLGAGSTGTVYSVEHTLTGELLALKVMASHLGGSPDAIARFKREAFVVSKIRSRHVVRIFDADVAPELGGAPYLVMDLLEGIDLDQLSDDQRVEPRIVVEWLRQVAKPLDKAHRLGIIHRDLKPANLFLTQGDDGGPLIKILDFGIARIATDPMSLASTQWGQLLGTPLYMAPEQARGDPTKVGPATDLYGLGLTAYKLLTSSSYRTGMTLTAMLDEILHEPPKAPSEVGHDFGPEFDCWFLRACQPDPTHRFSSAEQQIEALATVLGVPPAEATTPSSGSRKLSPASHAAESRDSNGPPPIDGPGGTSVVGPTGGLGWSGTTSPSMEMTNDSARRGVNPWRSATFVLLTALVILSLLLVRVARVPVPQAALVASPNPSVCDSVSVRDPPPPVLPPPAAASSVAVSPAAATATQGPSLAPRGYVQPTHPLPVRVGPARVLASGARGRFDNDPLSDQQ